MAKKLTLEQASDLHADGFMTDEAFQRLVDSGDLKVFRFRRLSEDKPDVIHAVNAALIEVIEANAFALFSEGYKPSISWMQIKKD